MSSLSAAGGDRTHSVSRTGYRAGTTTLRFASLAIAALLTLTPEVWADTDDRLEQSEIPDILNRVDGDEIIGTVLDLQSFGTREFHTVNATEAGYYIHDAFKTMGMQTYLQEFEVGDTAVFNVVAVLHPEAAAEGVYVIGAHYDSENSDATSQSEAENLTAPGADDNASGVGVMLEMARVLSGYETALPTVKFVAFGAEERGFDDSGGVKGSAAFAALEAAAGIDCRGAFVLDMVGYAATDESRATLVTNEASDGLAIELIDAADRYNLDISLRHESNELIIYSDHNSFWLEGYQSVLVIEELDSNTDFPVNPYYHTPDDTADKLSVEQMATVAETLLGTLLYLTCQGEDSYSRAAYAATAAAVISVLAIVILLLHRRNKGDA